MDRGATIAEHRPAGAWGEHARQTLLLAWPLVLSNLAGTGLATIDLILIGRLGGDRLAAAALATNLYHGVFIAMIGLLSAVAPLVASEYGRRRSAVREIRRTVRQGLWVALVACVPILTLLWFGEHVLIVTGQDPVLAAEAAQYLRALQWALIPGSLFVVLRVFIAALGRPGWGLVVALVGLPVNGLLAWLLIFGGFGIPPMGLVGAGVATTIASTLGLLALAAVIVTDRRFRRYHVFGRFWRSDWPRFLRIWAIGLPIAFTLAMETSLFTASGLAMGVIGKEALAAHTIALQIAALCFMVPLGLAQSATIRVGQAFGAGQPGAVGRAGWTAFWLGLLFTSGTALLLWSMPRFLVSLFIDPAADPAIVPLAASFLLYAALFQLADGGQVVGAGMLRGLQDTRVPMLIAAFGYWGVGAPLGYLLAFRFGQAGAGIWLGLATGLAVVAALMLWRWSHRRRILAGRGI